MVFTSLNIDMNPVFGSLAIGAYGVAYAGSTAFMNIVGTACIFVCQSHRIGDIITLNQASAGAGSPQSTQGVVKRITPFYTYIYGYDANYTIVPNSWFINNISRVWRSADQKCQGFLFVFGRSIRDTQINAFKQEFRRRLNDFEELDANESYTWLQSADYSAV